MLKRTSTAVWKGDGPKGTGSITTLSGALKDQPYGFNTRFASEDGKAGTNPEELIAAAHASCFTMATAFQLTNAQKVPTELNTVATVSMEKQDPGWTITGIHLDWCVEGNARAARDHGLLPIVIGDATGTHDPADEAAAFRRINSFFAPVISSQQFIELVGR